MTTSDDHPKTSLDSPCQKMDLGDCTLCNHPRRGHRDFERCTVPGCDCVRPVFVVSGKVDKMTVEQIRALHELAEVAAHEFAESGIPVPSLATTENDQ